MTIKQIKAEYSRAVPSLDLDLLLEHVVKKPRVFLLAHPETTLNAAQIKRFKKLLKKREKGYPLAYLTGEKQFYGLSFSLNPNVLVPRPETEQICDLVFHQAAKYSRQIRKIRIIDIGTGSGCIIISLAKYLSDCANIKYYASDVSSPAINAARQNARIHQLASKIKFRQGDLIRPFESVIKRSKPEDRLIITANLPYLTHTQIKKSPTIQKEPKKALDGGTCGLELYKRLFAQLNKFKSAYDLFCEIDPAQSRCIQNLFRQITTGDFNFQLYKDLAGYDRIAFFQKKPLYRQ